MKEDVRISQEDVTFATMLLAGELSALVCTLKAKRLISAADLRKYYPSKGFRQEKLANYYYPKIARLLGQEKI